MSGHSSGANRRLLEHVRRASSAAISAEHRDARPARRSARVAPRGTRTARSNGSSTRHVSFDADVRQRADDREEREHRAEQRVRHDRDARARCAGSGPQRRVDPAPARSAARMTSANSTRPLGPSDERRRTPCARRSGSAATPHFFATASRRYCGRNMRSQYVGTRSVDAAHRDVGDAASGMLACRRSRRARDRGYVLPSVGSVIACSAPLVTLSMMSRMRVVQLSSKWSYA